MESIVIRDCVHGDIDLTREEVALIDCAEFQRLREIRQLGTAYLVYPTALHTRFDHSIGTCHIVKRLLAILRSNLGVAVDEDLSRAICAAALLHDITHVPFGHTFEDERRVFDRHDSTQRFETILPSGEIGRRLSDLGLLDPVLDILTNRNQLTPPYASQLINATVCADLADYLKRDAFFCGLSHMYDDRVFRYVTIAGDTLVFDLCKGSRLRDDAVSEIIGLLRMRYFLSERVYYHHTKVASGAMVSKAVELATSLGELDLARISAMTDHQLLQALIDSGSQSVRNLASMLRRRLIYKRCYVVGRDARSVRSGVVSDVAEDFAARYHTSIEHRSAAESELARAVGLSPEDVIVYCPSPRMQLKEALVPVLAGGSGLTRLDRLENREDEIGALMSRHRSLWRFYVFVSPGADADRRSLGAVCEEYFGFRNEYEQ